MIKARKEKILIEMAKYANFNNFLSNWHLNDFYMDFTQEYYPKGKTNAPVRRAFNRYANMLVGLIILITRSKKQLK